MTHSVKEIMSCDPVIVHLDHPLAEAAQRMREFDIGALPVVDGDELVGVVTDRDLVIRGVERRADPATAPVSDAMTRHVVACHEDAPIDEAASLMAQERVRRLVVVNDEQELTGVISLPALARLEDSGTDLSAAALRAISMPMRTAKAPADEDPTGGRARGSPAGTLHVYAQNPRIRRRTESSSSE
jgi:CBS domain-containing protein